LLRQYPCNIIEQCPGQDEWSVRDVICHLRDYEREEDRARLKQVLDQENPFVSMTYDPWARAHEYAHVPSQQAFKDFAKERAETVRWLSSLPQDVWTRSARHSVFGPTTFGEMVKFMTDHDRTHLRQMHAAIEFALEHCRESEGA
jgi:hypothetical protein